MDASDGDKDLPKNIPELIDHLWDLYAATSSDPALEGGAAYIRQAALEFEQARRLAFEVFEEEQRADNDAVSARKGNTETGTTGQSWLRGAKAASPSKH